MGLFDFLTLNKQYEEIKEDEEDKKSKKDIGSGIALDESIQQSISDANKKYYRPDYNPKTRKEYYDSGSTHKKVMDDAFADGKKVYDPYTGVELKKTQREAKEIYGENWNKGVGEADHIDPLGNLVRRFKKNPYLTTDDIKEVANESDNYQVLSRKLNQNNKEVGKGGSTQKEWADDSVRMEGLEKNIESGESIESVKKRIRDNGEEAEKRNNERLKKKTAENLFDTVNEAGKQGALNAGVTSATMSGIMNIVSVIKGEKNCKDAVEDTIKDGGKAAITGYAMGGGLTAVSQTLSYSSSKFLQFLAENNVPGQIITSVMITGDTLKKWGNGDITTQECIIELGDKGLNTITMGYSMAVGQTLIPIPIVGGAVGALVGAVLTSNLYNGLIDDLKNRQYEHEERMKKIDECKAIAEQARAFRIELQGYLDKYFDDYKQCFDSALQSIEVSFENGEADGVIMAANQITYKLGGTVKYNNVDEFKTFLDSDEDDIL